MNIDTEAIDKVIKNRSLRDAKIQYEKLSDFNKKLYKEGKLNFSYSLSAETLRIIDLKRRYISGLISKSDLQKYLKKYKID